ncbi:hypothetical protein LO80_04845 [Candidatus Francisella endociliophora]|uniref:Uncharacterized protein n=1 Tax=Candidatus Francisella endociliophora TaxID=653937 RepID=A0A097EP65_9GAMM|nr:hypothetical protein LO80_04845 [Francisella sp. FSC1006]
MFIISIFSIVITLLVTLFFAKRLYSFSAKNNKLKTRADYVINGVILGFTFFCISSFIYVLLLNII